MAASRTVEAYEKLRADIVSVRYRPQEKLKIDALCADLGVSLGAVREALSRLTSEGLVVAQPQRGFIVAPVSPDALRDLTEVRIEIEKTCIARAIACGDSLWQERVREALRTVSNAPMFPQGGDGRVDPTWSLAHRRFHEALVSACDSPLWLRFRAQLFDQSERYRGLSVPLSRQERDVAKEHIEIAEATLARDALAAGSLLEQHFRLTAETILSA